MVKSEIINFSDKKFKKTFDFDSVFCQVDGIFDILGICNTPHDFGELSKSVFKTFQLGLILDADAPPPSPTGSSRKLGPQE